MRSINFVVLGEQTIANDFGKKLNSGSYLSELRRINIGEFSVLNALQIE